MIEEEWRNDLAELCTQLGLSDPPQLIIKRSRFQPLYFIAGWTKKPGASGGMGKIIISAEFLDLPPQTRRYLLAHELGHVVNKDSTVVLMKTGLFAATILTVWHFAKPSPLPVALTLVSIFLAMCAMMIDLAVTNRREFRADRFAAEILSDQTVVQGIQDMAAIEGSLTPKRKARLKALRKRSLTRRL